MNLPTVRMSRPPETSSHTDFPAVRSSRDWSTWASFTVGPISILPASGFSLPVIMRKSVDLPAPFGPMMPTIAPGGIESDSLSISSRSP